MRDDRALQPPTRRRHVLHNDQCLHASSQRTSGSSVGCPTSAVGLGTVGVEFRQRNNCRLMACAIVNSSALHEARHKTGRKTAPPSSHSIPIPFYANLHFWQSSATPCPCLMALLQQSLIQICIEDIFRGITCNHQLDQGSREHTEASSGSPCK
ncbi:hypothetical protein FA95DRAFT_739157 [Auriscalpium vulgare]|uniref:Uncharacterized protein n=1 Tax=Auriscalpium vulgare TaxID=40419 RepID=A0ACB8SBT3_9AGAM|nr:hypothetical protein FA95DRAFT_739157 [Auriscalpium vulgare]